MGNSSKLCRMTHTAPKATHTKREEWKHQLGRADSKRASSGTRTGAGSPGRQRAQARPGRWAGMHRRPSARWLQIAFLFSARLWVQCHSRTLECTQQAKCSLLLLSLLHSLGGWAFGWKPTCRQQHAAEELGVSAVYSRVSRATHNYAGANCVIGNASSFKLSLEYRGLILTIQQRF